MASLLLVEDHTMFRAGIRALVERSNGGHTIVGEAGDGIAAARLARELIPDLLLMDVSMPRLNGIETARLISKEMPDVGIVMLSMHADPAYVFAALEAGARAYVLKEAAFGELEAAIRSVLNGQKYLSTAVRATVASATRTGKPPVGPTSLTLASLSPRERQVLQLIAEACSSGEIAQSLGLKQRTVETYRQSIMDKLDLHSAAALTAFAIKHGVSSTDTSAHAQ
jgi:DNA-binding NarL/FixJ family response regulator